MTRGGLPHSDIPGSKLVCSSPGLFAACHVLHRLLAPRHSPYTLSSLTIRNSKLTLTNLFAYQLVCDSSYAKHCVCLWSEKTTVCRIFSCQRSGLPDSAGNLFTSGPVGAPLAQRSNDRADVGAGETRQPRHFTETFSKSQSQFSVDRRTAARHAERSSTSQLLRATSQLACQPKLVVQRAKVGGEYRSRTGDLLVANQALSQLS